MKPIISSAFSLLICLISSSALAQNRVLTVDNNPGGVAMFKDFKSAYQAAQDGDTILLAGSDSYYIVDTITKRLNLVGNGYFLQENNIPGFSSKSTVLSGTDYAGSSIVRFELDTVTGNSAAGSTLTGLHIGDLGTTVPITVDRCKAGRISDGLLFRLNRGRVSIRRSYVISSIELNGAGSSILNSIVSLNADLGIATTAANCVFNSLSAHESASISSSIFIPNPGQAFTAAEFASRVRGSVTHCMAIRGSFLPQGQGNINGIGFPQDVFVATGRPEEDRYWQLKPGSPASGKGLNGVDMGAFDGPYPYILSGVPSRPRVTRLAVPSLVTSASGLKFEVDAQSF